MKLSKPHSACGQCSDGAWWEGCKPQELCAQDHLLSEGHENIHRTHSQRESSNLADKQFLGMLHANLSCKSHLDIGP